MNVKMRALVVKAVLATMLVLALGGFATAGPGPWDIPGAWALEDPSASGGAGEFLVITRAGLARYSITWQVAKPPLFPGEATRTPYTGTVVRAGHKSWKYSALSYIQAADGSVIAMALLHGTIELVEDGILQHESWAAMFAPGQNPFSDLPAFGCFGPGVGRFQQVPIVEPCAPPE